MLGYSGSAVGTRSGGRFQASDSVEGQSWSHLYCGNSGGNNLQIRSINFSVHQGARARREETETKDAGLAKNNQLQSRMGRDATWKDDKDNRGSFLPLRYAWVCQDDTSRCGEAVFQDVVLSTEEPRSRAEITIWDRPTDRGGFLPGHPIARPGPRRGPVFR